MTKKNDKTENQLKKIGVPSGYVAITAVIVYYACNTLGACA